MGSPMWRACAALVLALLIGCVAPHEREIVAPPEKPDVPLPANEYDTYFTPHGVEVEAPGYIAERQDLFLLALQQIDELNVHVHLATWIIRIEAPGGENSIDHGALKIKVSWRAADFEPSETMLPKLRDLVDQAQFP